MKPIFARSSPLQNVETAAPMEAMHHRIDTRGTAGIPRIVAETPARLWVAVITLMGICVITTAWFPLLSITAVPSVSYNEGWNVYHQWMTVKGQPLYGSPAALWTTNYPFLSFHLIGLLGAAMGNMVLAGRIVCFASLIAISLLVGGTVLDATGSRAGALYAGLYLFAGLASFSGAGRAVDDPELLSIAFVTFGVFAYLKAPRDTLWLVLSAVAFVLSLFIKHDPIAFPLSVGVHLIMTRNWRALAIWLAAGAAVSGILLALTFGLDGPDFFAELLRMRAYSLHNMRWETFHYLLHFFVPLAVGLVLLLRDSSTPFRSFLFIFLLFSNVISIFFSGGDGVAANIFYPALIADLVSCVIAICWLERRIAEVPRLRRSFRRAVIVTTLAGALMVPFRLHHDIAAQLRLPAATKSARKAIAILKSTNGPAICEDMLLCYEAGKPLVYDPYYVHDQILRGNVQDSSILAMLRAHHYAAIQINGVGDKEGRFTIPFMHTLLDEYRPVLVSRRYAVFVPAR